MSYLMYLLACGGTDEARSPVAFRSTLRTPTAGVELFDNGETGRAGMYDVSCPFQTINGTVTGDYDMPGEGETVTDAGDTELGPETAAVVGADRVDLVESSRVEDRVMSIDVPGVVDARLVDGEVVAWVDQAGACSVVWTDSGRVVEADCGRGFDAIDEDQVVVVGASGTRILGVGGVEAEIPGAADLVVWDDLASVAYVAELGGHVVTAIEANGLVRWTTDVDGAITALDAAGDRAAATVAVSRGDVGALLWLDGASGLMLGEVETPAAPESLSISANGEALAVVLRDETHFYDLVLPR